MKNIFENTYDRISNFLFGKDYKGKINGLNLTTW